MIPLVHKGWSVGECAVSFGVDAEPTDKGGSALLLEWGRGGRSDRSSDRRDGRWRLDWGNMVGEAGKAARIRHPAGLDVVVQRPKLQVADLNNALANATVRSSQCYRGVTEHLTGQSDRVWNKHKLETVS